MKSKVTAYLLWFFLGVLGAHKFYLKKTGMGILYLLTLGLFGIGWLVDLFTLGRQVDLYNNPELAAKPPAQQPPKTGAAVSNNQETEEFPEDRAYRETMARHKPEKPPFSGQHKPSNEKQVNYRPLLDLCTEIENNADNNYLPFDTPISVEIVYSDRDEETTLRAIDVRYIAKSDYGEEYYIKAYCHLRNEDRTFKVERIQKTIVGEKTVDFIQYLVETYRKTDKYKESVLSVKTRKLLNSNDTMGRTAIILTYISRIDGTFTRKEKTLIAAFLKELDNSQNEDIEIENYVTELAELKPTAAEYKNAVKTAEISEAFIEKAKEITGKDPLRLGAFEILNRQFEKNNS